MYISDTMFSKFDPLLTQGANIMPTYSEMERPYEYTPEDNEINNTNSDDEVTPLRPTNLEDWSTKNVISWVIESCRELNYDYEGVWVEKFEDINGRKLLAMSGSDFESIDTNIGSCLYEKLSQLKDNTYVNFNYQDKNYISLRPKLIEQWTVKDVVSWIIEECRNCNYDYEKLNTDKFNEIDGRKLLMMTNEQFINAEYHIGSWLYTRVQQITNRPQILKNSTVMNKIEHSENLSSKYLLPDVVPMPVKIKRSPGRPRTSNHVRKKSEKNTGRLWEFIKNLLFNEKYCPRIIAWVDPEKGIFRFVQSTEVAKLWGSLRGNKKMNYEKLSRAMRYYYKTKVFEAVHERLVYKFGPNAKGWKPTIPLT